MEGIARLNAEGVYTYMNPAHAETYGFAPRELIDKTWREVHPADEVVAIEQTYFPILKRDGKWRGVLIGRRRSGELFDVELSLTTIVDEIGVYQGLLCTCIDVSERVRAKRALRQSERRFRNFFNSTYQFMGLLAVDGTLLEVNDPALMIAGLSRSDVIGQLLWETPWFSISDRARVRVRDAIARAAKGEFMRYELAIFAIGRRAIMVDFSLKPIFDDAGLVVQIIPEGRDITVTYELTQKLRQSERRVRTIADNIPAMIGYMDRDKLYRFVNKNGESWFGM